MKNKKYTKFILLFLVIILSPILFYSVKAEEEATSLDYECTTFYDVIIDSTTADLAIECNKPLTDEQFLLASPAMQEKYVLTSQYANFLNEPQRNLFINTILKDEVKINDNKVNVRQFLKDNKDYSISDPTTKKTLKQVFEKTANESADTIKILNEEKTEENRNLFQKYFSEFSPFLYVKSDIEGYDSKTKIFTTKGDIKSKFTTDDLIYFQLSGFSNFFIEEDGRLSAKNYNSVEICTDCNYYISPSGKKITVLSGKFSLNEDSFASDKPYQIFVDKDKNTYTLSGTGEVTGMRGENILFKVDGSITVLGNLSKGQYILDKNSEYTQFEKGEVQFTIKTKNDLNLFTVNHLVNYNVNFEDAKGDYKGQLLYETTTQQCTDSTKSCIQWNPNKKELTANTYYNAISLQDQDNNIKYLNIKKVTGQDAQFTYSNGEAKWIFDNSYSPVSFSGNPFNSPIILYNNNFNSEMHEFYFDSSLAVMCSTCTAVGEIYSLDEKNVNKKDLENLARISGRYKDLVFNGYMGGKPLVEYLLDYGFTVNQTAEIVEIIIKYSEDDATIKSFLNQDILSLIALSHEADISPSSTIALIRQMFEEYGGKNTLTVIDGLRSWYQVFEYFQYTPAQMSKFMYDFNNLLIQCVNKYPNTKNPDEFKINAFFVSMYINSDSMDILKNLGATPDFINNFLFIATEMSMRTYDEQGDIGVLKAVSIAYDSCRTAGMSTVNCIKLMNGFRKLSSK